MEIKKSVAGSTTNIALAGRLDTVTCNKLAAELASVFEGGAVNLNFDFQELEYISSAGLRVLLTAQKKVNSLGTTMEIRGANESVKEVFDITGFSSILTII